jgi:membrane protein implicated in regulation of membrane protease activity
MGTMEALALLPITVILYWLMWRVARRERSTPKPVRLHRGNDTRLFFYLRWFI